jgi:hypothetical protein
MLPAKIPPAHPGGARYEEQEKCGQFSATTHASWIQGGVHFEKRWRSATTTGDELFVSTFVVIVRSESGGSGGSARAMKRMENVQSKNGIGFMDLSFGFHE